MIDSPCNNICTTDSKSGLCIGCGRTQVEISNWLFFDDKQKKTVLMNLKRRNKIFSNSNNMLNKT